VTM
jgi:hypothetical protein